MASGFNECVVEDATLNWFGELDYAVLHGQCMPLIAEAAPCGTASLLLQRMVDELH